MRVAVKIQPLQVFNECEADAPLEGPGANFDCGGVRKSRDCYGRHNPGGEISAEKAYPSLLG